MSKQSFDQLKPCAAMAGWLRRLPVGCLALIASTALANAAIVISSDPTSNMSCAANLCKSTAPDAVLNVTDLANLLATSNVRVTTNGGTGAQANDISVEAALTWASTKVLTFTAHRAIRIDQPVTVSGTAGMTLSFNTLDPTDLSFGPGGKITFWDTASQLMIGNRAYALENDIASLAADIASNPNGFFALARDYDASVDGTYATSPIPSFGGVFEGLGHTISNLTIDDPTEQNVGLFGLAGTLRDIGLTNAFVNASSNARKYVGVLVGGPYPSGVVIGSFSTGSVTGAKGTASEVGGLAGRVGSMRNSYSSATVLYRGSGRGVGAGGLVGTADSILNSHATGSVTVRLSNGNHAFGFAAGLADRSGHVENSYAAGNVTLTAGSDCDLSTAGGLVAYVDNLGVSQSFATGNVHAACSEAGGLVGRTYVGIQDSYSTGSVTDTLVNADFAGDVVAGGLVGLFTDQGGDDHPTTLTSYSIGRVSSADQPPDVPMGGFGGKVDAGLGPFSYCYWDTQASARATGFPGGDISGVTGVTTHRLKTLLPRGFKPSVWAIDSSKNNGFPYLIANPPPP